MPILLLGLSPHAHILLLFLDGGTSSEIEAAIGLRHCRNKMILKYLFLRYLIKEKSLTRKVIAHRGARTPDHLIKSQALYRLS